MLLVTTERMRQLEHAAVEAGATWEGLMEQAGQGVAQHALSRLQHKPEPVVLVLVGPGNNGGDGLVAARHLHDAGVHVALYIWNRQPADNDANWARCRTRGIAETFAERDTNGQSLQTLIRRSHLIIDALLGMGVNRPVTGHLASIVKVVNSICRRSTAAARRAMKNPPYVLAIDVPTGIHSDHGAVMGQAVYADMTVATGLAKYGLMHYPGKTYAGTIVVADIGLQFDKQEMSMCETITSDMVRTRLPARPDDSHKGTFGKALIVAGSLFYPGAAVLASAGAARVGAGLVTLATARSIINASGRLPEVTLLPLPEADVGTIGPHAIDELDKHVATYHALLVGPGLGTEEATVLFLKKLLGLRDRSDVKGMGFVSSSGDSEKSVSRLRPAAVGFVVKKPATEQDEQQEQGASSSDAEHAARPVVPTVIDADGLNILAEIEGWSDQLPESQYVLTPHPGEMKRLLKQDELDADRVAVAIHAATQWRQVVVLKGATTVVASPDGQCVVHAHANPALATAGTGDVLAGAITGFLAQGVSLFDAAVLGVFVHAAAGDMVRRELGDTGALASDLLLRLPQAIKQVKQVE